jgi:ABC-type lipoprotein release transport system permease subunit
MGEERRRGADRHQDAWLTLLGIFVSVAFLVAVTAIIRGMNAYVKENIANAIIGARPGDRGGCRCAAVKVVD